MMMAPSQHASWGTIGVQRFSTFSINIRKCFLSWNWKMKQLSVSICFASLKTFVLFMSFKNQDSDSRERQWLNLWQIALWSQQTYLSGQIFRVGVGQMGKSETSGHSNWKKTSSASCTTTGQLANKDQANKQNKYKQTKQTKQNHTSYLSFFYTGRVENPKFYTQKIIPFKVGYFI